MTLSIADDANRLIADCLGTHGRCRWPVSLAVVSLAVWEEMSDCGLDLRRIAGMVAFQALEQGRDVVFDVDLPAALDEHEAHS